MSPYLITALLCVALIGVLLVKRRQDARGTTPGAKSSATASSAPTARRRPFSRATRKSEETETPRRRMRPRLALSVPGELGDAEPVASEIAETPYEDNAPVIESALVVEPAAIVATTPAPAPELWDTDELAGEETAEVPVPVGSAAAPAIPEVPLVANVVLAPGWPEPGELSAPFVVEDPEPAPDPAFEDQGFFSEPAGRADVVPYVTDAATHEEFDPATGWASEDIHAQAWTTPDVAPAMWSDGELFPGVAGATEADDLGDPTWSRAEWSETMSSADDEVARAGDADRDFGANVSGESVWETPAADDGRGRAPADDPIDSLLSEASAPAAPSWEDAGDDSSPSALSVGLDDARNTIALLEARVAESEAALAQLAVSQRPPAQPTRVSGAELCVTSGDGTVRIPLAELLAAIEDPLRALGFVRLVADASVSARVQPPIPRPPKPRPKPAAKPALPVTKRGPRATPKPAALSRRHAPAPITLTEKERVALRAIAARRSNPALQVRARIILAAARGLSTAAIAAQVKRHPSTVRRWRRRFQDERLAIFPAPPAPRTRRPRR